MAIKSTSVKIGADTTEFIKGLKKADKSINSTYKEAKALEKSLNIKFDETRFLEAQKSYQNALAKTEAKAEDIRKQLKKLEDSGRIDTKDYTTLQTELAKTEAKAITLNAQLEKLNNIKMDQLATSLKNVGGKIEKAGTALSGISIAAAGAIVGAGKLAKDAVAVGDDINTMSDQFDLSTTAIQKWEYVALQGDVAAEKLFKAANKTRDALGSQMRGEVNAQTEALEELNISMSQFENTEDAFDGTIEALAKVEDKTMQYNIAVDLFGDKVATEMLPLLNAGSDAISGWSAEFEQIGYLSEEQVTSLAKFDEQMNIVNEKFEQAKIQLGIALLPLLEIGVDLLTNHIIPAIESLADWFSNLSPEMQNVIIGGLGIVAVLSPMLTLVGKTITGIGNLIPLLGKLKTAGWKAALGMGALVGALVLGVDLIANWQNMSTVEKILKTLAVAALVAAGAITVFHASWSLGIAIGAIAAGVTAGIAAINAAKKKLVPEADDISVDGIDSGNYSMGIDTTDYTATDYTTPTTTAGTTQVINDTSTTEINITLNATGDLDYDVEELADRVNEELAKKALSY